MARDKPRTRTCTANLRKNGRGTFADGRIAIVRRTRKGKRVVILIEPEVNRDNGNAVNSARAG